MTTIIEDDLQMSFDDASSCRKFDGDEHGLSHCMRAVDFVIEFEDRYFFIEIKDPQHPRGTPQDRRNFVRRFQSGRLDEELKYKYRDSFLYEWASGRADKPIYYLVLIALDTLTDFDLASKTEGMNQKLPSRGPGSNPWIRPFVSDCAVFNMQSWNRTFPQYPVRRVSADSDNDRDEGDA